MTCDCVYTIRDVDDMWLCIHDQRCWMVDDMWLCIHNQRCWMVDDMWLCIHEQRCWMVNDNKPSKTL
jgi:hypothetical protein